MLCAMRMPTPSKRLVRGIIGLLLAVIASVRAGGVALACESATAQRVAGEQRHDGMAEHAQTGQDGCDEPERVRECDLMAACAPAVSTARTTASSPAMPSIVESPERVQFPASIDRSPEPPPPRA